MTPRRSLRPAVAPLVLVVLCALLSCVQGAPTAAAPTRTLSVSDDELHARPPTGAFGVVFAGPQGATTDPSEVTIVFNRPMRPLEVAGEESAPPATIEAVGAAAPKGRWQWLGTSALAFFPEPHLMRATEYVVTVPAGTRALDGSVLGSAYAFRFSTPEPRVVRVEPSEGDQELGPTPTFTLRFNQPVEPNEAQRAVRIEVGEKNPRRVAVRAAWIEPPAGSRVPVHTAITIVPVAPLPLDSAVALVVGKELRGVEGPRTLGEDDSKTYRTYGPLVARAVSCSTDTPHHRCAPRGAVGVELSTRVSSKEFRAHARVEGARTDWGGTGGDEYPSTSFSIPARLRAATRYRVVVTAGMKDVHGQVLASDAVLPFETDDEWPDVEIGLEGSIFESDARSGKGRDVPVASVNADSYELVTAALDEKGLAELLQNGRHWRGVELARVKNARGAKAETVRPSAPKNQLTVRPVHLDALLAPLGGHGAVAFGVGYAGERGDRTDARIVNVTDLAISAKMSRFGSLAWVTRLSDGKPVGGAAVSVLGEEGREVFRGTTDAQGLCPIPASAYSPVAETGAVDEIGLLVARHDQDWTWRRVADVTYPFRYAKESIELDVSGELRPIGMIFTDRGVYRPGETVKATALFRAPLPNGTETPRGRDYVLEAFDSVENKVFEHRGRLGDFGELTVDVPIPASARLGMLELRAELGGPGTSARAGTATHGVLLAAYKPAEFKVGVEPDKPAYVRGDTASFTTRGDYLFGAPMSAGKVRFTVARTPAYFALPGGEGLVYDDAAYAFDLDETGIRAGRLQSGDGALDAAGTSKAAIALTPPTQRGPELVTFESEVEDVARQVIAGRTSAILHPGEFYVAMRPPKDFFAPKGSTAHVDVSAIAPDGAKRAGVPVAIELVRRSWRTVVEASGESSMHYRSRVVDTKVGGCDVKSAASPAGCDLPLRDAGYFIVRASAKDARGNVVAASTPLYVVGEGEGLGWQMDDAARVDLVPDKKSYEVGDTARILVKNPYREAEALVTVERHGIYRTERTVLRGPMPTLTVPITDDLRPNAFVAVHLVHGRSQPAPAKGKDGASQDVGAPSFRLGYAELRVNPEARRLKVSVTPARKDLRPGDEVDVELAVADRAGKPTRASVTFYAVDEGVLMLTGYKTPDPIPPFTAPRPLAVMALESREDLAKVIAFAGVGEDKGLAGGGGGASVREDFRATAHFAQLVTGADGKARVHFKLPDATTTYRLMAVAAAEDDRFGSGESQVVTSRPLMARPALPRFLRAGDAFEASVVLSSKGMKASRVEVTLAADGVSLGADATKTVDLPANGDLEVRWPVSSPRVGRAAFTFRARALDAPGASDQVKVTRAVDAPIVPEAIALYGDTTGATAEQLGDMSAIRSDVGGLDVRLASSALVGLDDGVEQLVKYPYGCTEQLTSRLVPLLPLRDLAKDYGFALPADADAIVAATIGKIAERQHSDGSFGWWPDSPRGDAWITAYALWGLAVAREHGAQVPDGAIANAKRFVRRELERPRRPVSGPEAAFIVDVLAQIGDPDPGFTNKVYEQRAELPLFARALLAHAMATSKMSADQQRELVRDVDQHLRVTPTGATVVDNVGDKYAALLDSEARTTAMAIRALAAMDPKHPLLARLAKGLLGMREHGAWRSTQETAWALLALDDYRRAQESAAPDFDARVFLAGALAMDAPMHGRSVRSASESFPMDKLFGKNGSGAPLVFQAKGSGRLFYEARLRYARKELPKDGIDRGFYVRKFVRSVKPDQLADALRSVPATSATSAAPGDLVLVDLLVVTPDPREQVVIDDPLPAGLEALQKELATSARSLDVTDAGGEGDTADDEQSDDDARANDGAYTFAWYHREVKDDRVLTFVQHMPAGMFHYRYLARATTLGAFVTPPTRAECMYEPETFGRTGAATFEVKAR